jgi:hypothetical protein
MNYEEILARQPASTSAGDRSAAQAFVAFLSLQITGGLEHLNGSQQRYLYKLRSRWEVRAAGDDPRWNETGSRPGRPRAPIRKTPPQGNYRREEETDPLLASILRKYGTPRREDV